MKLDSIQKKHVIEAAEGIPPNSLFNNYWVLVNGTEYPFVFLCRTAYRIASGEDIKDFTTGDSYLNHIKGLSFEVNYHSEGLSPISERELSFYKSVAGEKYRANNNDDIRKGDVLRSLVRKINFWAEKSVVDGFEYEKDNHWQWSGTFKSYLWIRIVRPKSSGLVYFIVSCDENGDLVVEIDCQHSNHSEGAKAVLSPEIVKAFYDYRDASDFRQLVIKKEMVSSFGWEQLINRTQSYITEFIPLYDELEALITQDKTPELPVSNGLQLQEAPDKTKSYAKNKKSFQGVHINWERKLSGSKGLGDAGEEIVRKYEVEKLQRFKLNDLAEKVEKRLDGVGYDIQSYNEQGEEVHIEVKTTQRGKDEPFYMSLNEREFLKQYPENYFLFRLYDFNFKNHSASYYILSGKELLHAEFTSINYEVSI